MTTVVPLPEMTCFPGATPIRTRGQHTSCRVGRVTVNPNSNSHFQQKIPQCFILAVWPVCQALRGRKELILLFPREIFTSRKRKDSYLACNAFDVNLFASLPSFARRQEVEVLLSSTLWRESLNVLSSTAAADCNNNEIPES